MSAYVPSGPTRTNIPGRWHMIFPEALPEGAWRATFLRFASETPAGRQLALAFEGSTLEFNCPDPPDREHLKAELTRCTRIINDLKEKADRHHGKA